MTQSTRDTSARLFFDSFSKHLRCIRDDGKDSTQAYRAQILLGQLQQFEKAIAEMVADSDGSTQAVPEALDDLLHLHDFEALIHWLTHTQKMVTLRGVFFLDGHGQWQNFFGEAVLPKRLKVGEWGERGLYGSLDGEPLAQLLYLHGQPRLVLILEEEASPRTQALISFIARSLSLYVSSYVENKVSMSNAGDGVVAADAAFLDVLTLVKRVAQKDVTVLLEGESGTGKEVIANYIHHQSNRNDKPFVAVNCAAIPAGLIESELFGHEKGSFTGAHQRKIGRLEEAQGGTLFLDEIGEIELAMQAKLLRFIQLREFHRVGGRQKLSVNVRIVAATNRNLKERAAEGAFREDLYYRLSVAPFRVPPLRERVDDIVPLAKFFLSKYIKEFKIPVPEVDEQVFQLMAAYPFPGNVRELENLIQNILVLSQGERLMPSHLPESFRQLEPRATVVTAENGNVRRWRPVGGAVKRIKLPMMRPAGGEAYPWSAMNPQDNDALKAAKQMIQDFARDQTLELERAFLKDLLDRSEGHMPTASRLSGINRTLLYKMLDRTKDE